MNVEKHKIGLVVMIGLPGSGKSTLTKTISQYIRGKSVANQVYEIVYDDLIPATIQSGSDLVTWRQARETVIEEVKSLICKAKEETHENFSNTIIIIDDNMYYRSMRYAYFQLARLHRTSFCQLYKSISLDIALDRNKSRIVNQVPAEVIVRMSSKLQPPDCIHNTWEKHSILISSNDTMNTEDIYTFIFKTLEHVVPPIVEELASEVKSNEIHEADLELRKIIGAMVRNEHGDKRSKAAELNDLRRQVLEKLRVGDMSLPAVDRTCFLTQQLSS